MGLLDDAIREHLDLKRRRGADPNEVERLEREALGPVRRPQPDSLAPFDDDVDAGPEFREESPTGDWPETPPEPSFTDHNAVLAPDEEFEYWEAPEPPAPLQSDERGPVEGAIDVDRDAPAPRTPVPPLPPEQEPGSGSIDEQRFVEQETVEHDVEGEELARPEGDDDMLEETPDFLQDTPDHDRLWFEQRPPRDFDLDG
jgi:hypothetical protein